MVSLSPHPTWVWTILKHSQEWAKWLGSPQNGMVSDRQDDKHLLSGICLWGIKRQSHLNRTEATNITNHQEKSSCILLLIGFYHVLHIVSQPTFSSPDSHGYSKPLRVCTPVVPMQRKELQDALHSKNARKDLKKKHRDGTEPQNDGKTCWAVWA